MEPIANGRLTDLTEVCVEGLPPSITVQELKDLFSECGPVFSVELMTTVEGHPMGIAKVTMGQVEGAEKAVRILNHIQLDGRTLLVFRTWAAPMGGLNPKQESAYDWGASSQPLPPSNESSQEP